MGIERRPRGVSYDLPKPPPVMQIGARLSPACMTVPGEHSWSAAGPYYRGLMLRYLLRNKRKTLSRIMKAGVPAELDWDGKRLPAGTKDSIRDCLHVVDNAYEIEIVGIVGFDAVIGPCGTANQCYIGKGVTTGIQYYAKLMFRATLRGNEVAYMHPKAIFPSHWIERHIDPLWELEKIAEHGFPV